MPPSLKDRGGRLQAFVRKNSDSTADYNASAPKSDTLVGAASDTPQDSSHEPSRQELAEAARLSLPPDYRNGSSHQQGNGQVNGQARFASHSRVSPASSTPQLAGKRAGDVSLRRASPALFSGSQLGESFMNSGLSTPQNEPEEVSEGEATPNARRQSSRSYHTQKKSTGRGYQSAPPPAAFRIGENLMMSVVLGADRGLPQMMDGFRDDAVLADRTYSQGYGMQYIRPSPAAAVQSKLPMREVRVKRLPAAPQNVIPETHDTLSPSPSMQNTRWPGRRNMDDAGPSGSAHDSDRELDSLSAREEAPSIHSPGKLRGATRRFREGSPTPANTSLQKLPRERKRRRGSPDYDDKVLSSMAFSDLADEPFDLDPAKATAHGGQDASAKLPLKLEQYRQQGEREQRLIFAAMTLDEWEASGDWFVDQFAGIMVRLRDARRNKRRMVQGFEDEAARREEAVRLRSETIDRKLAKMRQDGQRVVDDKSR